MAKKKTKMMMMVFVKFKEPTIREISFQGNKKNAIDEALDKALIKPRKNRRRKNER